MESTENKPSILFLWPFFFIYLIKLIWTLFHLKNYLQAKQNSVAKKLFDQESEGKLKK